MLSIIEKFSAYREALEERVSNYLAENLEEFLSGFDYMQEGMERKADQCKKSAERK